jgi:hypothetical protein
MLEIYFHFLLLFTFNAFKSLSNEWPIRIDLLLNNFNKRFCTSSNVTLQFCKCCSVIPDQRVL